MWIDSQKQIFICFLIESSRQLSMNRHQFKDPIFNIIISIDLMSRGRSQLRELNPIRKTQTFSMSKLLPYSTSKLLPTVSEHRNAKKHAAKGLTHFISRFNNFNRNQSFKFDQQLIRSALAVNNFQQLFSDLYEVFRRFTFVVEDPQLIQLLINFKMKPGCSMRKGILFMEQEIDNIMRNKQQRIENLQVKLEQTIKLLQNKQQSWQKEGVQLQAQVKRYQKLADISYMKSLEAKVEKLNDKTSELQTHAKHLAKQNEQFLKEIEENQAVIEGLKLDNAQLKTDIFDLNYKREQTQSYFKGLKNRFDDLVAKMMGIKQSISKVEKENESLISERAMLANRAAIGFQDLTPRPKYNIILGVTENAHRNSTADIFSALLDNTTMQRQKLINKVIIRPKNYKLQQCEAIRRQVVEEVIQAKKEINKI